MAKVGADRRDAPRFQHVARRRGGGYAAQVGRFGETTLPVFIRRQNNVGVMHTLLEGQGRRGLRRSRGGFELSKNLECIFLKYTFIG